MNDLIQMPVFAENIILLLLVILVKSLLCKVSPHEPFRFFRFYCLRLADKVNNANKSLQQQQIAGLIATVITLVPIVVILSLFETLIEVTLVWNSLLLYLALGSFGIQQLATKVAQAIAVNDKYQAKQLLATQVLRDTEQLSSVGICKACIEMTLLRTIQQQFVVAFVFLAIGPLAALSYRLLLEMHYSWNSKQHGYFHFGKIVHAVVNAMQWLPVRVFLFLQVLITLNQPFVLYWRLVSGHFFRNNNNIVVNYLAYTLTIKLGGVAMYNLHKIRRISFNEQGQQPEAKDIIKACKHTIIVQTVAVSILMTLFVILVASA